MTKRSETQLAKSKTPYQHPEVQKILVRDFNRYIWGRWRQQFKPGLQPTAFESCDWQLGHRDRKPAFYTKHSACHWLCNFSLRLAQLVESKRQWRIITSQEHSTVWDGERRLFDFNFEAMGVSAEECFALAYGQELKLNEQLAVHLAEHWRKESQRREKCDAAQWTSGSPSRQA